MEFALTIPVFLALIFGMTEIGRGFMVTHLLNSAARNGCRTGILSGKSNTDVTTAVTNSLSGQGISGTTTTIKVNGSVADVSTASSGDEISVTVSVSGSSVSWLGTAMFLSGTLSGRFALRHE